MTEIIEIPVVKDTNNIGYSLKEVGGIVGGILGGLILFYWLITGIINSGESTKQDEKFSVPDGYSAVKLRTNCGQILLYLLRQTSQN